MTLRSKSSTWFYHWFWLIFAAELWGCSDQVSEGPGSFPVFYPGGNGAAGAAGTAGQPSAAGITAQAGAGGMVATAGAAGNSAGRGGAAGSGTGGSTAGKGGAGGKSATGGTGGASGKAGTGGTAGTVASGETGRMVGMTAAHNAVRAEVDTQTALSPLTWSSTLAAYAQEWTDSLATTCNPQHRSSADLQSKGYGENLAMFGGTFGSGSTAQKAVDGWAGEVDCWTFGTFMRTDNCDVACYTAMNSDGCGHYTQIVWRKTTEVGCGVSTCSKSGMNVDIWVCNYKPAGNYVGQNPY